jgi:TP901 family phage tail tape measure protein
MASDLLLRARLTMDSNNWSQGLRTAGAGVKTFSSVVQREMRGLQSLATSTAGKLAGVGFGFSAASMLRDSAMLDKGLNRIGNTSGSTALQIAGMRSELHKYAIETGTNVDTLRSGVASLVGSGLTLRESQNSMIGINRTMAVTGASAETLSASLSVASQSFGFDLGKAGQAQLVLDKMAVAADLGSAEVESLGGIFARVGVNAQSAGFSIDKTLALVEGLSKYEKNADRLSTLTDSTLRVFTNQEYMKNAQKASGVKFFTEGGMRRDPLAILDDLKKRMDKMKTDAQRESFLSKMLGGADMDTVRGFRMLTTGTMLNDIRGFSGKIESASGKIASALPGALANSVNQAGRLQAVLFKTADGFGQRINGAITTGLKKLIDDKANGGLGLSGEKLVGGAAVGTLAAYAGSRALKGAAGRFLGGTAGLASGVAMGTALEKAGAATPVFIVGAAPGLFSSSVDGVGLRGAAGGTAGGAAAARVGGLRLLGARAALAGGSSVLGAGGLASAGAGGLATVVGGVGLAGAGGAAIGYGAHKAATSNDYTRPLVEFGTRPMNEMLLRLMALVGNKDATGIMADRERQKVDVGVGLDVRVTDTRVTVTSSGVRSDGNVTSVNTRSGPPVGVMMREGRR